MSEVKRYGPTCDCMSEMAWGDYVRASEYDALQSRLDAAERNVKHWQGLAVTNRNVADAALAKLAERDAVLRDWRHAAHVRPSCQLGVVERCRCMRCVESRTDALLSSAEPVKAEFCCELSFKAAKQAAWGARDLTQCKCDHNEYCEHCWPSDFRQGGKWHGKFKPAKGGDGEVDRD